MGQRTRNHIIEDKSRLAFNEMLPENWVYRDKDKDYGIDCEVEIFDEVGNTTGFVFWVQLKGTESQKKYNIRNVTFTTEKIFQFQNYIIPVLIVRYSITENILYYSWAHDIVSQIRSKNQIKVQFTENRILDKVSILNIQKYLSRFQKSSNGNIKLPLKTYISKDIFNCNNVSVTTTQLFKKIINNENQYYSLVRNEEDSDLQLKVGDDKLYLSLSDWKFSSIGYDQENLTEENFDYYTKVLLVSTSIILYNSNKEELADDIFFSNSLLELIKDKKEYLMNFLPHLLHGKNYQLVLEQLNNIFDISQDNTIQNFVLVLLISEPKSDLNRQIVYENFLLKQIEYAKAINYKLGISLATYNLGNYYRSIGNYKKSLFYYLDARRHNNEYKKKAYFYFEIAGVLFELGKYLLSSRFYTKAIEMNTDYVLAKALLGDSLLYLGSYEKAVNYIDEFLTEQKDNQSINLEEWYLKFYCIKSLILNGYPKNQKRDILKSINLMEQDNIDGALESDLLNSYAWMKKGIKAVKEDERLEAFISFTMSSLLDKSNIFSWVCASIHGFIDQDEEYFHVYYVIRLAYYFHGESYIEFLNDYLTNYLPEALDPLINFIDIVVNDKVKNEKILRIFEDEKNYIQINLQLN